MCIQKITKKHQHIPFMIYIYIHNFGSGKTIRKKVRLEEEHIRKEREHASHYYRQFYLPQLMASSTSVGATHYAAPLIFSSINTSCLVSLQVQIIITTHTQHHPTCMISQNLGMQNTLTAQSQNMSIYSCVLYNCLYHISKQYTNLLFISSCFR